MAEITVDKWALFKNKPGLLDNIDKTVKESIVNGDIPKDAKVAGVGVIDSNGIKVVVVAELLDQTKHANTSIKIKGIFEHDWDGNNSAAAKLVFSHK